MNQVTGNLRKGMDKQIVNKILGRIVTLEDKVYKGVRHTHAWKCHCGKIFKKKWYNMKQHSNYDCGCIRYNQIEQRYKEEVEKTGEYEYIRSYRIGEKLQDGTYVKNFIKIHVKHKYCGNKYVVNSSGFISIGNRCPNCCQKYENSFAHHIEVELGEPLEKYWDFEKNTVNPYHISRGSQQKVWIYCQNEEVNEFNGLIKKDYHGSYKVSCANFIKGNRCGLCHPSGKIPKVHHYDSFGYFLEKNGMIDLWSDKNKINPYEISINSNHEIYMICGSEDTNELNGLKKRNYHSHYKTYCYRFREGGRCPYCNNKKHPHIYDSLGYSDISILMSWHPDNDISPFKVAKMGDSKKYKLICDTCGKVFYKYPSQITIGQWCPECSMSKGEKKIAAWLRLNNIEYEYEKTFNDLIGLGGRSLSYDFYLPKYNILIEYQGKQHLEYTDIFHNSWKDFEKQLEHDYRKNMFAISKKYNLIKILHYDYENIEDVLKIKIERLINDKL